MKNKKGEVLLEQCILKSFWTTETSKKRNNYSNVITFTCCSCMLQITYVLNSKNFTYFILKITYIPCLDRTTSKD